MDGSHLMPEGETEEEEEDNLQKYQWGLNIQDHHVENVTQKTGN